MQRPLSLAVGLLAAYVAFLTTCYFAESYGIKRHQVEAGLFILVPLLLLRFTLTPRERGPQVRPAHSYAGFVIIVAVIGCVAYGRALEVGLLSDDFVLRAWAVEGRVGWGGSQFARPVALAVWRIIFQMGAGASVLHALNIGLHLGNVVVGGRIAGLLGLSRTGVAIAALTFLVWPTQVEPVVWAAGVFDVLASSFMLLALWICLRAAPLLPGHGDVLLTCVLSALALFTKESAVALPALGLIVVVREFSRTSLSRRQMALVLSLLVVTAAYIGWRLFDGLPVAGTSSFSRYTVKEHLSRTFAVLAVPYSAATIHSFPLVGIYAGVGTVLFVGAAAGGSRRLLTGHVVAVQGALWCIAAAVPTIGYLFIGPYLDGSRYVYLSALGWGLMFGGLMDVAWRDRLLRWPGAIFLALQFLGVGFEQQRRLSDWRLAATEREMVLAEAREFAAQQHCGSVSVSNLPPRVRGAQLFNNGFSEAIAGSLDPAARANCRWTWTGSAFRSE